MISKTDRRYFLKARNIADLSDFHKIHIGCVAVYQGKIIGVGYNTDKTHDIARKDYNKNYPTVFYRPDNHPEASLLHRVLTYAPTYSIGYVDPSLYNLNRQFSCKDQAVYDFLQDVAQEIGCIFVFTPDKRVINVFDVEDHCTNPDCNGSRHIVNGVSSSFAAMSPVWWILQHRSAVFSARFNVLLQTTRIGVIAILIAPEPS